MLCCHREKQLEKFLEAAPAVSPSWGWQDSDAKIIIFLLGPAHEQARCQSWEKFGPDHGQVLNIPAVTLLSYPTSVRAGYPTKENRDPHHPCAHT